MARLKPYLPAGHPRIAIVGEAPGQQEELLGAPFVGASGQELTRMLSDAGITRKDCYLTNVFFHRPQDNNIEHFCGSKAEVGGRAYPYPLLRQGKYLKLEHLANVLPEDVLALSEVDPGTRPTTVLERLRAELVAIKPTLVLALGNTACWALLGNAGIKSLRGTVAESSLVPGLKVLPTYHPAMVMRDWSARPVCVADFGKALRESTFREIRRPKRLVHIAPTFGDIASEWMPKLRAAPYLSIDIETGAQQIKCIGFAPSPEEAYVIPFVDFRKSGGNYWPSAEIESAVWRFVRELCSLPCPKIFQNGMYDVQYLWRFGVPVRNFSRDTMLMHHALMPEMDKGLGFLGSVYTNEASWKLMRPRGDDEQKRDE